MPTPREIRRKISSTRNTQKITKALEMVSSVKLRKARVQMFNARPYAAKIAEIAAHLAGSCAQSMSPLMASRQVKKTALIIVGSDKGMCGGFNSNVFKKAIEFIRANQDRDMALTLVGKKSVEFFKRKNFPVSDRYLNIFFRPSYADASRIGMKLLSDFLAGQIDEVRIVYNEFKNTVVQKTVVEKLLPVSLPPGQERSPRASYIIEPESEECLDLLLTKCFLFRIWHAFLESFASEQGARMAAMSGASKNAGELIEKYTLHYNKARQTAITKELLEVVSGAESLR